MTEHKKFHLSEEQIKELIDLFPTILSFILGQVASDKINEVTEYALSVIAKIKTGEAAPTVDDLIDVLIKAGKIFAAGSENQLDDKLVKLAEIADKVRKGEAMPIEIIGVLFEIIAAGRQLKKENQAEKNA